MSTADTNGAADGNGSGSGAARPPAAAASAFAAAAAAKPQPQPRALPGNDSDADADGRAAVNSTAAVAAAGAAADANEDAGSILGAHVLVANLVAQGVRRIFCIPGAKVTVSCAPRDPAAAVPLYIPPAPRRCLVRATIRRWVLGGCHEKYRVCDNLYIHHPHLQHTTTL